MTVINNKKVNSISETPGVIHILLHVGVL